MLWRRPRPVMLIIYLLILGMRDSLIQTIIHRVLTSAHCCGIRHRLDDTLSTRCSHVHTRCVNIAVCRLPSCQTIMSWYLENGGQQTRGLWEQTRLELSPLRSKSTKQLHFPPGSLGMIRRLWHFRLSYNVTREPRNIQSRRDQNNGLIYTFKWNVPNTELCAIRKITSTELYTWSRNTRVGSVNSSQLLQLHFKINYTENTLYFQCRNRLPVE